MRTIFRRIRRRPRSYVLAFVGLTAGVIAHVVVADALGVALWGALSVKRPDELVRLWEAPAPNSQDIQGATESTFIRWSRGLTNVARLSAFVIRPSPTVIQIGQNVQVMPRGFISPALPELLGMEPIAGRNLADAADEVLISEGFWRRAFGGDPRIIDRLLVADGRPSLRVVGVLPDSFRIAGNVEIWSPWIYSASGSAPDSLQLRLGVVGRLRSGSNAGQLATELTAREARSPHAGWRTGIVAFRDSILGPRKRLLTYGWLAALVLLVLGAAAATQLLIGESLEAVAESRLMMALGATPVRLLTQAAAETVVVIGIACLTGCGFAFLLRNLAAAEILPGLSVGGGLGAAVAVTFAALTAVIVPARSIVMLPMLRAPFASPSPSSRVTIAVRPAHAALMVQLTLTVVLLCVSSTFGGRWWADVTSNRVVHVRHVTTATFQFPLFKDGEHWEHYPLPRFARDALSLRKGVAIALPGAHVALSSDVPLTASSRPSVGFRVGAGRSFGVVQPSQSWPRDDMGIQRSFVHRVSPGYFATLNVALVAGRDFTDRDSLPLELLDSWETPRSSGAVIIDDRSARRFFGSPESALGQRLLVEADLVPSRIIVGVAAAGSLNPIDPGTVPHLYLPFAEAPLDAVSLLVCCPDSGRSRQTLAQFSTQDTVLRDVTTIDRLIADQFVPERNTALAVGAFGLVALTICASSLYGMMASALRRRRRELAVRLALGASPSRLSVRSVSSLGLMCTTTLAAGLLLGLASMEVIGDAPSVRVFAMSAGVTAVVLVVVGTVAILPVVLDVMHLEPAALLRQVE